MIISKQFSWVCAITLLYQQALAAPMPPEWGATKTALTFEDGCPNISGVYENVGEGSKDNPSHRPYDIKELDVLLPFRAKTPNPPLRFVIRQDSSLTMETTALGTTGEFVKFNYVRGDSERESNNNFGCEANAIVLHETIEYSGEQGKGVTDVKTSLMLATDNSLIVHQTVHKKLTSLLIFTSNNTDEYWWRFLRK